MNRATKLMDMYEAMQKELGPSEWWPGDSVLEIMLGAVLTQNTAWSNVEKAIANLRGANALNLETLNSLSLEELARLIYPAGFFRVKARRIGNLLAWIKNFCHNDLSALKDYDTHVLREELLAINGIGPETADSILLYAFDRPSFVVDEYTRRIFSRHALVTEDADYAELRDFFMDVLPEDSRLFNEYHASLVRVAKNWCKRSKANCETCPLSTFLPE